MIVRKENIKLVKSRLTEKEFLESVLSKLYSEPTTPQDVFLSKFKNVEKKYVDIIVLQTNYEGTFSLEWENKKEVRSTIPADYTKLVVSEWVPFEDSQEAQIDFFAWNDINKYSEVIYGVIYNQLSIEKTYKQHKWILRNLSKLEYEENADIKEEIEIDDNLVRYLDYTRKDKILAEALLQHKFKVPGTNWRAMKSNNTFKETEYFVYRMPIYRVEFEYRGKTYYAEKHVCASFDFDYKFPEVAKEQTPGSKAVDAEGKYERMQVMALITLPIVGVLTLAFNKIKILLILGIIIMVLLIGLMVLFNKIKAKAYDDTIEKSKKEAKIKKMERMKMYQNAKKQINGSDKNDEDKELTDIDLELAELEMELEKMDKM